jgi:lysophospholipase L1-like esterase
MARKHQNKIGQASVSFAVVAVLSLLAAGAAAYAQDSSAPQPKASESAQQDQPQADVQPTPVPLSSDCQLGNEQIVEQSPLPNVAAALKKRKQVRILTIGSSSSVARRSSRGGSNSDQIRQILQKAITGLDVIMISRGVSGELAAQAAARVKNEVALQDPDLVLWQVGTNDALAYVPIDDLKTTVVDTVHWLRSHHVDVVLVGLQYVDRMAQDDHYRAVRDLLRGIAKEVNVMIVRRYEAQKLLAEAESRGGGLAPDEFQRNEAGYVCLSQYMARAITLGIFGQTFRVHPLSNPPAKVQD